MWGDSRQAEGVGGKADKWGEDGGGDSRGGIPPIKVMISPSSGSLIVFGTLLMSRDRNGGKPPCILLGLKILNRNRLRVISTLLIWMASNYL